MPLLSELSALTRHKRAELGLTQERLAQLAGLSRVTINQLETGKLANLSLVNAEQLANAIGYGLGVTGVRKASDDLGNALKIAARTASVSFDEPISVKALRSVLLQGVVAPSYIPHLKVLLDEAPLGVLSDVAEQLSREDGAEPSATWQKVRQLAVAIGCTRSIWQ